jgi:hypothetical protein
VKIRRFFRQPVVQEALLKLPETPEMPCEIRNFCQAGLLLKLTSPDPAIALPKSRTGAEVAFTADKTSTTFHMEGKLSHVSASGVGFVFDFAPPFQVLQALQQKAIPNPVAEQKIPSDLAEVHAHCVQALENALYPLLDNLPPRIQATLAESALQIINSGGDSPPTPPPFSLIIERFYAHVLEQARSFVVPDLSLQPEAGAIYSESQSQRLMFEDWMNLIDKVIALESKYENVLKLLEASFSVLVQRDVMHHDNPFGPNVICHSFHYSLQGVELDNHQRSLVYDLFTSLLDERLTKLFIELRILCKPLDALKNPLFEEEKPSQPNFFLGATPPTAKTQAKAPKPTVREPVKNLPEPGVPRSPQAQETAAAAPKVPPKAYQAPVSLGFIPPPPTAFSAFVALFRYAESQGQKGSRESLTEAERTALIAALRKLQDDNSASPYFIAPRLQTGLGQVLTDKKGQEKILSKAEVRENLQILGLMLDVMLADLSTATCVAPYFKRLQIPLLAGSFIDPLLVHGHSHPARELCNQLDYLAQAANAQGDLDSPELLNSLDTLFGRLAREAGLNPDVFAEVSAALEALTSPLIKAYATRLERLSEGCEGGQRLEMARRLVDREIDARLGGKTVPAVIPALLDAGWRQLLVLTQLRQGVDNDDWRRQLMIIDVLMTWLAPNTTATAPTPLNVQNLKSFIEERLSGVGSELTEIKNILEKIDHQLFAGAVPAYVDFAGIDATEEEKQVMLSDRLQGFREGEWLKFSSGRGVWIPLRLSWIGQTPPRYVFSNRKAIKALDLDAARFIQFLDEKRASRMENLDVLNLVERTSKSLLSTLRDRLR